MGSQPLGRPVALTLRPPLNLPLGGGGVIARGRGDVLLWEGVVAVMGVVGAVREPLLRVGRRERGVGVAVNLGHPPARCARVPLRGAKGG